MPTVRESEVLKTCLAILAARGVYCWRNNVGSFAGTHKGVRRFVRFGMRGASDIIGCLPDGRMICVETKAPGKRPTVEQVAFLRAVNAQGGFAVWVDDPKELDVIVSYVRAVGGAAVVMADDGSYTVDPED